jgi:hypothetical protein
MFRTCVAEYLAQKKSRAAAASQQGADDPAVEAEAEVISEFVTDVEQLLIARLSLPSSPTVWALAKEIGDEAEYFFTIEKKRQNVRGEGFEDTLQWLILQVAGVPTHQLRVRTRADALPGFKPPLNPTGKDRDKVPKPDLAVISHDKRLTLWLITAKWSLRQDRLDQFGQECAYYQGHRVQPTDVDFVLVTNEMDLARLRGVLNPPPGTGSFHFSRVYHLNLALVEHIHGPNFQTELGVYKQDKRLLSLSDLLEHLRTQVGGMTPPPGEVEAALALLRPQLQLQALRPGPLRTRRNRTKQRHDRIGDGLRQERRDRVSHLPVPAVPVAVEEGVGIWEAVEPGELPHRQGP